MTNSLFFICLAEVSLHTVSHANKVMALAPTHATTNLLLFIHPPTHTPDSPSIHPSVHQPSYHPPIHSSIHLSTHHPSTHPSTPSIHPPFYVPIHPPTIHPAILSDPRASILSSIYPFIHLCTNLHIHPFHHLTIYPSTYQPKPFYPSISQPIYSSI